MRELDPWQLAGFLHKLGALHDASITRFSMDQKATTCQFEISDFTWNFEGFPEYPGVLAGCLSFTGVTFLRTSFNVLRESHWILEFRCDPTERLCTINTMGGTMIFGFVAAEVPEDVYQWTQAQPA